MVQGELEDIEKQLEQLGASAGMSAKPKAREYAKPWAAAPPAVKPVASSTVGSSSLAATSRSAGASTPGKNTPSKPPQSKGVHGYVAAHSFTEEEAAEARSMSKESIYALLESDVFAEAMQRVGVKAPDLLPQTIQDFYTDHNNGFLPKQREPAIAQKCWEHAEAKRIENLALVLDEKHVMATEFADGKVIVDEAILLDDLAIQEQNEQYRIAKMRKRAAQKQHVLDQENNILLNRRAQYDDKQEKLRQRNVRLAMRKQLATEEHARKLAKQEEEQKEAAERAQQTQDKKRDTFDARVERQRERMEELRAEKMQKDMYVKMKRDNQEFHRAKCHDEMQSREQQRVQMLLDRQDDKARHLAAVRFERDRRNALQKEERSLRKREKEQNAERVQSQIAFNRQKSLAGFQKRDEMYLNRKELKQAFAEERQEAEKEQIIRKHKQDTVNTTYERNIAPGKIDSN